MGTSARTMGVSLTDVGTTQQLPLGFEYHKPAEMTNDTGEEVWVYILADEALEEGDIVEVKTDYANPYHGMQGNAATAAKALLGVAQHVIASGSYGFIQKRGKADYVKGDGSVAAGDALVSHGSGAADTLDTDEGDMVFGYALTADAADSTLTSSQVVCSAMINCGV